MTGSSGTFPQPGTDPERVAVINLLRRIRSSRLGRREIPAATAWQVIGWWEARRIPFNMIVGVAGAISGAAVLCIGLVGELVFGVPFGLPDPPIFAVAAVVLYALGANVCFAGGWMAELIVRRTWPDESDRFGTLSFTLGLVFAVVVTLLPPVVLVGSVALYGLLRAIGAV